MNLMNIIEKGTFRKKFASSEIIIIGNSNNELARLASHLSLNTEKNIHLFLIQKGILNDPINLPDHKDMSHKILINDLRIHNLSIPKVLGLIWKINLKIKRNSIVILNSFSPGLILRKSRKFVFFSTGSDITTYANWAWFKNELPRKNRILKSPREILSAIFRLMFVYNQRRVISKSQVIVCPESTRDPAYDSISKNIFRKDARRFSFQFSKIESKAVSMRTTEMDAAIHVLVGCRLDDGSDYPELFQSNFNNKNPGAIFEALSNFVPLRKIIFYFIEKGNLRTKFLQLHQFKTPLKSFVNLPELPYDQFICLMDQMDIVIDSLGPSIPGRISIDALALKKFLIVNSDGFSLKQNFSSHIFHAQNALDLIECLENLQRFDLNEHTKFCPHDMDFTLLRNPPALSNLTSEIVQDLN